MTAPPVVGVVGSGPAAEAARAALADADARAEDVEAKAAGTADLSVVVAPAGAPAFARVNRAATGPWLAVELGGVGGRPFDSVDAAVSVLRSDGGCFECLRARVRANADGQPTAKPRTTRSDARLAGAVAGWLAVAHLSGEDVSGTVVELPHVERRLLPVPGCGCAPDRTTGGPPDRSHEEAAFDEVVARVEPAIDDRVGVVRDVGEAHSFPAPYYLATLCDTTGFSDAEAGPQAAGVAADWNPAFVKAIGEAVERYAAGCYRASAFDVAAPADLDDAVPPSAFVTSPAYDDPDPTEPIPWVVGESLHSGASAWLPAEFAVFPPPERRHVPSITTGLGLGSSGVGALLSGLTEVVERDATMLAWYSTFEPLGLSVENEGYHEIARRARAEDLAVTPLLVTQDVDVPVVSVAVHRERGWPQFAAGSDAALDAEVAARAALEEALQNWMELRGMGEARAAEEEGAIARYADFPDEARAFVDPAARVDAADLGPAGPLRGQDLLDALTERLEAVGLEAYAVRLTTRDVEALGLEVVRVLVPGAQPLFTGQPFFGERARAVPEELGFEPRLDRAPHPYP